MEIKNINKKSVFRQAEIISPHSYYNYEYSFEWMNDFLLSYRKIQKFSKLKKIYDKNKLKKITQKKHD